MEGIVGRPSACPPPFFPCSSALSKSALFSGLYSFQLMPYVARELKAWVWGDVVYNVEVPIQMMLQGQLSYGFVLSAGGFGLPDSSYFSEDGFFLYAVFCSERFFAGLKMKSARLSNLSEIGPISLYLVNMRFFSEKPPLAV